ncbi:hypothetical protein [Chryseobacterium sp. 2987]|uniref:hypothetical protein n=1 Tax=Chryseobacterium sp. 2987 TaxID=2817767 RepID=UPI002855F04A|nr:hypothetical protein [Chryseobacterium sp. 2987]MDR6923766.1 hypothetical protein [Chryseobacterium sp. 2987]
MKILYFAVLALLFSCSKSAEENCFVASKDELYAPYEEQKPYTVQQILNEKPAYLEIINLTKYRDFKKDSIADHTYDKEYEENFKRKETDFKVFDEKFSKQFWYTAQQKVGNVLYALARNNLGYWLLKIENNKPSAYFLGLSFSHYYFNKIQEQPIIQEEYLQIEGSLVKIIKVPGLPGYDDYSAQEDGKLFKIKLKDLMKDTDKDGYNDIFEKSLGLNSDNKDTDGDGINDFEDMNPMYKSDKNKFTQLYELLLLNNGYGEENQDKRNYSFLVYESGCDYFHQVNPGFRVLFISEDKRKQTAYTRITDITDGGISKIQKNAKNPDIFYIYEFGSSSSNDYSAEYKNGKWEIQWVGGIVV